MRGCDQATITDADIANLVGISELKTAYCSHEVRIAAADLMSVEYEYE